MRRITATLMFASAALAVPRAASAQFTDFASCPATLPACSSTVDDCCYKDFPEVSSNRAIIIPLDRCHQQIATAGKEGPPTNAAPAWCEASIGSADEGMFQAYGLVYRLMQNGINVHWVINPTKYPPALLQSENAAAQTFITQDIDMWVLDGTTATPPTAGVLTACGAGCTDPVRKLNAADLTPANDSYNFKQFPLRGSAFIIAPEDRTRFNEFFTRTGEFDDYLGDNQYDFSAVDLYEVNAGAKIVYQNFTTAGPNYALGGSGTGAPVAIRIDYDAPRVARLSPAGVSAVWLSSAKLNDPADSPECLYGSFTPSDAVYCDVSEADIQGGSLIFGRFNWAWIDNWSDNSPCGDAAETTQVDEARQFMMGIPGVREGGNVLFMDAVVSVMEGCVQREPQGALGSGLTTSNTGPNEPFIIRYPQSAFTQWGDVPTTVASGSVTRWTYFGLGAVGYDASHTAGSLVRLLTVDRSVGANTFCSRHRSGSVAGCDTFANNANADIVDFASYVRFQEDERNGLALYLGGNNVNSRNSHLRLILNSLLATPNGQGNPTVGVTTTREVTRATPIVATVATVEATYQGTVEVVTPSLPMTTYDGADDDATFEFPYFKGHFRAVDTAGLDATADTDLAAQTALFDVADAGSIPTPDVDGCATNFNGECRSVFTTVETPGAVDGLVVEPDVVFFDVGSLTELRPLLGDDLTDPEAETLISRILAGTPDPDNAGAYIPALGGIDHSTAAVIEPTPLLPTLDRPTMIYVGASDGMLHAICAEQKGPCPAAGRELWAFMPRTQVPLVRENSTRIDGSPKVADVFGDWDGTGIVEVRTVLTLQTGWGQPGVADRSPAVIALDITDPSKPAVLWEWTTRASRGDVELGVGLNQAMAPVRTSTGGTVNVTVVQTSNGGLGKAGFYLAAINTVTGELVWEVSDQLYPSPRDSSNNPPVPTTGIPSGVAMVDRTGEGLYATHIVVPSLYGDVWLYDVDGTNSLIDPITSDPEPLFRFSADFRPIGATPTIYADLASGTLHAAFVSGGYADQLSPLGIDKDWSPSTADQWLIAVTLTPSLANVPFDEDTAGDFGGEMPIKQNLGAGQRGFAQAIVTGDDIFVVTDNTDVNLASYGSSPGTGSIQRRNLTSGALVGSVEPITGGASSAEVTGDKENIIIGSGSQARRLDVTDTFDNKTIDEGRSIENDLEPDSARLLWIGG